MKNIIVLLSLTSININNIITTKLSNYISQLFIHTCLFIILFLNLSKIIQIKTIFK